MPVRAQPCGGLVLATAHDGWHGLPLLLCPLPGEAEERDVCFPEAGVALALSGSGRRCYKSLGRVRNLYTAPGMLEFYAEGYSLDYARWDGQAGEVIAVHFPRAMVNRFLKTESRALELDTRHEVFDDRLGEIVVALWSEASRGSPSGRLYAEGLTLALLGLMQDRHGAHLRFGARKVTRFSADEKVRIRALIAAELSGNLGIERLAAEVGMSPDHFSKVFKESFERTPHAYVIEQRIDAAARALRSDPNRSVADIACTYGFSSQSHLTDCFRRKMGTTPARWRRAR